jgi:predicted glutamine amidotransferase
MCGIFAWSGKDPKKFNKDKFDKLGIFNIDRGKDSCGVSFDGEVYYGLTTEKLYSKFIVNREIKPLKYPVVIGHTRQASVGNIVNERNAHPFGFGNNSEGNYEFIGCHNGTLYNHKDLASTFKIDTAETIKVQSDHNHNGFYETVRQKIDSEILLEIIYKTKNFKVLSQYNGAAALVFTNTNEPNVIYVWKGASRWYDYVNYVVEEERPLFYYKETKNSLYISSIQESLETIGGITNVNLFKFSQNTIYKITDGDVENAEKILISRNDQFQKEIVMSYTKKSNSYYNNVANAYFDNDPYVEKSKHSKIINLPAAHKVNVNPNLNCKIKLNTTDNIIATNIYKECLSKNQNEYKGRIYFNKFRHWQNGHTITGIYTWINNYGYYKIGEDNFEEAHKNLNKSIGVPFIKNSFIYDTKELDLNNDIVKSFIPFKHKSNVEHSMYYFIQGVKVLTKMDYSTTYLRYRDSHIKKGLNISYIELSEIGTHPIIDLAVDSRPDNNQSITLKGKQVEKLNNFFILGSDRAYSIEKGNLMSIKVNKNYEEFLFGTTQFKLIDSLEELIKLTSKAEEPTNVFETYLKEDNIDYTQNEDSLEIDSENDLEVINELIEESSNEIIFGLEDIVDNLEKLNTTDNAEVNKKIQDFKAMKDYMLTLIN